MSKYVEKSVFQDPAVNSIIDRMYYELGRVFDISVINTKFGMTGRAAYIHQNETPPADCNNVIFITNDAGIYNFMQSSLRDKMPNKGVTLFKERTLFYFDEMYMEIWFDSSPEIYILEYGQIFVQRAGSINPILL